MRQPFGVPLSHKLCGMITFIKTEPHDTITPDFVLRIPAEEPKMITTRHRPRKFAYGVGVAVCAAMALGVFGLRPLSARAAVTIDGNATAISLEAQNSSMHEILELLTRKFGLHYRSSANLNNTITGTYRGSLRAVVARLLDGQNFVMRSGPSGLELTVFGNGSGPGSTSAASTATGEAPSQPLQNNPVVEQAAAAAPGAAPAPEAGTKPNTDLPAPEIKLAQGPVPVPTPGATGKPLPAPPAPSKSTNLAAPPAPAKDAPAVPAPEVRASKAVPPVPANLAAPKAGANPKSEAAPPAGAAPQPGAASEPGAAPQPGATAHPSATPNSTDSK
jgi:hypothetical protein